MAVLPTCSIWVFAGKKGATAAHPTLQLLGMKSPLPGRRDLGGQGTPPNLPGAESPTP